MAVDITTIGIEYDTSGLEKGTRAQDKTRDSANKMADSLGVAEKSTKSVAQATNYYTTALQAAAAAMGISKIIDQIDQYTKFTAQLKLATGSTAEYAASLNAVRQISKDAQSSLAGTGTLYAKIATGTRELGVAQSQVAKITESINLSLKVSGATAGEAASAQLQLAQAFASGTLRGEEFNAVNEAAPRLMKALADGMGRPVGALKDMASNGLITSEIMANVLPKALEQLREEAKQVQTISGAFQVLKNNVMEFIGTQSQASGVVSVITGAVGLLADNLVILAGAIVTITATKFANFLSGVAVSAYESVAANRALAAANLATAQSNVAATASTLALADARVIELRQAVLAASGEAALAVTMNGLIPAQARATAASLAYTEALAAQTVAVGAASTGAGILRGALAFLGGPIGLIVTALGVAATAWSVFGDKAEEANDKTTQSTIESSQEVIARLDQEISKLKDRNKLRSENPELAKGSSEANLKALTQAQKDYNEALAGTGKAAGLNATAQAEMVKVLGQAYGQIYQRVNEVNSETKKLTEGTTSEKMKKWLGENGSAAQRMAAALAEAKKEVGVLTPEMEKLIKKKFEDKQTEKEKRTANIVGHTIEIANLKQIKEINKDMMNDRILLINEVDKESEKERNNTKKWMQEQRDNYASENKSLDDHAQKMLEANELAQLEIDLLGTSAVERNTIIEQKKIQLALDRELQKIREMALTDTARQDLIDKATAQANIDKSTAELRAQQGEWTKFYSEIYNGLSDSLYRGFEAGKGFGKSFLDSIKNLFKTNVLKIMVQAVMGGAGGMVSGMASAMSGGGGSEGGAGSYISLGKSIYEGFSSGFTGFGDSVANYVQAGLDKAGLSMSGGGNGALASGAGTAASYLGGAAVGIYGGRAISGGYSVTGGNAAVNIGTIAGAIFGGPIGAAIGGLIGGGINRLFGMKAAELQSSEMSGTVGAGGFQASTKDTYLAKGGLFRSDKWSSTTTAATDTAGLTAEYDAIKAAATGYASMLGLSATAVESYTKSFSFSISKTGDAAKDAEINQKHLADLFIGISDDITKLVAPSISALSKTGETAAQTLGRLAIGLTTVNGIMNAAGFAEFAKSLEGASAANRLSELTGGIEKLSAGTQFFVENFLTDAEKIKPSIEAVSATMARLGQSSVDTIPEFKSLVQGLDLTSESGAKMYAELIAIAPQFKAVADYVTETTKAVEDNTAALQRAKQIEDERRSLQDEYNQLTMTSTQLYELYKNGLDESNRALADSIQAIKLKSTEEAAAAAKLAEEQAKANAIASERSSIQNEINQLTMTSAQLLDLQRSGLNEANRALFDFLQATKEKIATEKQLADIQKSIEDQRFSLMAEYNDLTMTNEQRLQAQRFAIDQSNVALYDQIVALKDKNKADAESAALAKSIADQRKSLQDEYNNLTMTEAQLLDLRRSTYDAANRDLFDAIQAEKATHAKALEDQKAYNDSVVELQRQAQAIASERASLQDEYNQLTMTEIQLMELKRSTLNESNRDLFDLIQAEKLRRTELAKAEESAKNSQSEWVQAMKDAYDTQKGILSDIVSEFGSLLKSLKDFGRNLTTGDLSKASPEDKYKLLGAEVAGLIPKVQSGDKKAIADFMDVADEYLKASEDFNALNTQYFKDKDYIKKYIDEAAAYAQGQVDVATLQLNALNGNISATNAVNQSVQQLIQAVTGGSAGSSASVGDMSLVSGYKANVLQNLEGYGGLEYLYNGATTGNDDAYRTLKKQMDRWKMMGLDKSAFDQILGAGWYEKLKAIPGFAKGGLANGLAMVGENGAELVNFKSPARVYNSSDTKSILGGNAESSKETNDLLKKQNALMEKLISKLEGAAQKQVQAVTNVAQKIGVVNANAKFEKSGT